MRSLNKSTIGVLAALGVASLVIPKEAQAATPCSSLGLEHPVYGSGGSAITADLAGVATALAGLADPITILYADGGGACTGYQWFIDDAITGTFKYWNAAGTQSTCDPPITGQAADFAHMGNLVTDCPDAGDPSGHKNLPSGFKDFQGPIQTLNIITDKDSAETSISAQALYFIYGFGAASPSSEVEPWLTTNYIIQRQATSFASLFLGKAIGVDPAAFVANTTPAVCADQTCVMNTVRDNGVTAPDATLGYVSGSAADARRNDVKILAYQDIEQSRGYWPDSDQNALDKINVRKGLYALWSPGHFFAKVNGQGQVINPDVENLIGWYDGSIASPQGINIPALVSTAGDIPSCAMYVTREGLTGAISSYAPPDPCHCFFEVSNGEGEECVACESNADCGGDNPECRHGYCEAY